MRRPPLSTADCPPPPGTAALPALRQSPMPRAATGTASGEEAQGGQARRRGQHHRRRGLARRQPGEQVGRGA